MLPAIWLAAEKLAREVVESGAAGTHRCSRARNLLGKLLLSRAEWDTAEEHFAADICRAAALGDSLAELRARVNRAIALLSRGSSDEARSMLIEVLERAEARGEPRAVGFALSNLAVLAIERHDYAQALELSERAISVRRRLGDRLGFARDVTESGRAQVAARPRRTGRSGVAFRPRRRSGRALPRRACCELALAAARTHLARGARWRPSASSVLRCARLLKRVTATSSASVTAWPHASRWRTASWPAPKSKSNARQSSRPRPSPAPSSPC